MSNTLQIAQHTLLQPGNISQADMEQILNGLLAKGADYADLYFQLGRSEYWFLEDGMVKDGSYNIEQGVGVRAVSGEKTGFAYADDLTLAALQQASNVAGAITSAGQSRKVNAWQASSPLALYPAIDPLGSLSRESKVSLLEQVEKIARDQDPRVNQVMCSLSASQDIILVAASDGDYAADVRPLVRLNVSVIAAEGDRREQGSSGGGGRHGYELFWNGCATQVAEDYAKEAVRQALVNLDADDAPAGSMTVVVGAGWPGVLLHEAIGHGLEGDFNRKGTSAFSGRMGEQVASPLCTVVDDGTLQGRRGSLSVDDEGTQTNCTTLIENGVLTGYIHDKLNARLMGHKPTGNGRRESFAHLPMPRMTNTYMRAGESDPAEIIASVEKGLYAVNFGGGQVDITSGKFVFGATEAYLIENGKITRPVRGATLIGDGPSVLTQVSMVGNDLALDPGVGVCGKDGQSVPVGVGQPTLKIDAMTVGGTQV
jgi:TldD protein